MEDFCCYTCRTNYQWKQKHPSPEPVKSLGAWNAEAKACGLDYGTYRGLIECGKTFEELKMKFDESKLKK